MRDRLAQQSQFFSVQCANEQVHPGHVAARSIYAGDKAQPHRIAATVKDDRNCRCRSHGGLRCGGAPRRGNHSHGTARQIRCQRRQPVILAFRPPVFDRYVLPVDVAGSLEALAECGYQMRERAEAIRIPKISNDVSKDRLDVVVLPEGRFCSVSNDTAGWAELVARLRPLAVSAIGLEPSGGYERGIIRACSRPDCRCDVSTRTSCVSSPALAASWPRTIASMRD